MWLIPMYDMIVTLPVVLFFWTNKKKIIIIIIIISHNVLEWN